MGRKCHYCGSEEKVYQVFNRWVCLECIKRRRTGKRGHSGMIPRPAYAGQYTDLFAWKEPLSLVPVRKSHPLFVKWFLKHYPKSKGIVGRSLNFLIYRYGEPVGIIGFASPPLGYRKFSEFFRIDTSVIENANKILNNNVFKLVRSEPNLGTQILKLARQTVKRLYKEKYGDELVGLVTFVEPPRIGTVYRADNWVYLGMTQGIEIRRNTQEWYKKSINYNGTRKHIFAYRFEK